MSAATAVPLVLIPALLCDEALYADVLATLGDVVDPQVIVASRSTVGESVAEILARAPTQFVLVGSSYGGTIAIEVALAAPQRVIGLWLNDCDPGAPDRDATLGLAHMLETTTAAAVDSLASVVVRSQAVEAARTFRAMAERVGGQVGGAQARALASRADAWGRLGELTMPALVLWGAEDAAIPVAVGRRLAASLGNAQLHELADCGHLPVLERPHDVAAIARDWLRALAASLPSPAA